MIKLYRGAWSHADSFVSFFCFFSLSLIIILETLLDPIKTKRFRKQLLLKVAEKTTENQEVTAGLAATGWITG